MLVGSPFRVTKSETSNRGRPFAHLAGLDVVKPRFSTTLCICDLVGSRLIPALQPMQTRHCQGVEGLVVVV